MKTRSDFVSNSSSCSFIVEAAAGDGVAKTFKMFSDVFTAEDIPYDIGDSVRITARAKNKWFKELYEAITYEKSDFKMTYEDWSSHEMKKKDPEEIGWESIPLSLDRLIELGNDEAYSEYIKKLDSINFSSEDCDSTGIMYLRMIYLFLERTGCCPSAAETEHSFLDDNDNFITKLCAAGGTADGLSRFRNPADGGKRKNR